MASDPAPSSSQLHRRAGAANKLVHPSRRNLNPCNLNPCTAPRPSHNGGTRMPRLRSETWRKRECDTRPREWGGQQPSPPLAPAPAHHLYVCM